MPQPYIWIDSAVHNLPFVVQHIVYRNSFLGVGKNKTQFFCPLWFVNVTAREVWRWRTAARATLQEKMRPTLHLYCCR